MSSQPSQQAPGGIPSTREPCLQNFHILTWDGEPDQPPELLHPTHLNFSIVTAAVHYALCIMDRDEPRRAIKKLGIDLGNNWVENGSLPASTSRLSAQDMEVLVEYFLRKLRSSFFSVVIAKIDAGAMVVFEDRFRTAWEYPGAEKLDGVEFEPKDIAVMYIDAQVRPPLTSKPHPRLLGYFYDQLTVSALRSWRHLLEHTKRYAMRAHIGRMRFASSSPYYFI